MVERSTADRIGGLAAVGFGALAIWEAIRLFPMRTSGYVGDHMTFALLGSALIVLGTLLATVIRTPRYETEFPQGSLRTVMLLTVGLMLAYRYLVPILGYLWSTFPVAFGLFKVMGAYKWPKAAVYAAILTCSLYLLFEVWLQMSLPGGMF